MPKIKQFGKILQSMNVSYKFLEISINSLFLCMKVRRLLRLGVPELPGSSEKHRIRSLETDHIGMGRSRAVNSDMP